MIKIPEFKTIEEMARFWDSHDITDFEDQLIDVKLDSEQYEKLKKIAEVRFWFCHCFCLLPFVCFIHMIRNSPLPKNIEQLLPEAYACRRADEDILFAELNQYQKQRVDTRRR